MITHGLATVWSAFQLARTGHYMQEYENIIVNDVCEGVDVFPGFWSNRIRFFVWIHTNVAYTC